MNHKFVLLERNEYTRVVESTSKKHFDLVDSGWNEVISGSKDECEYYEAAFYPYNPDYYINLYCHETFSLIITTDEMLNLQLNIEPNYLNNKVFL